MKLAFSAAGSPSGAGPLSTLLSASERGGQGLFLSLCFLRITCLKSSYFGEVSLGSLSLRSPLKCFSFPRFLVDQSGHFLATYDASLYTV